MSTNILLLCGGDGSEHDISLLSAKFIKEHPDYEVMPEELDIWEPYFKPYYEAINSPLPLTLE